MSEKDFLSGLKADLRKAIIAVVISFIGTLIVTVFAVRGNSKKVTDLEASKADKELVQMQFKAVEQSIDVVGSDVKDLKEDLQKGQEILLDILTNQ